MNPFKIKLIAYKNDVRFVYGYMATSYYIDGSTFKSIEVNGYFYQSLTVNIQLLNGSELIIENCINARVDDIVLIKED